VVVGVLVVIVVINMVVQNGRELKAVEEIYWQAAAILSWVQYLFWRDLALFYEAAFSFNFHSTFIQLSSFIQVQLEFNFHFKSNEIPDSITIHKNSDAFSHLTSPTTFSQILPVTQFL
jgi:hypothetical protein